MPAFRPGVDFLLPFNFDVAEQAMNRFTRGIEKWR
jgi:hypothetical protein